MMEKFTKELLVAFLFSVSIILFSNVAFSAPVWSQKPVQCGELAEVIQLQESEGLKPLLAARGHARIDESPRLIEDIGYIFYYDQDRQYWSMIEIFREDYACVIAMGTALQFN